MKANAYGGSGSQPSNYFESMINHRNTQDQDSAVDSLSSIHAVKQDSLGPKLKTKRSTGKESSSGVDRRIHLSLLGTKRDAQNANHYQLNFDKKVDIKKSGRGKYDVNIQSLLTNSNQNQKGRRSASSLRKSSSSNNTEIKQSMVDSLNEGTTTHNRSDDQRVEFMMYKNNNQQS